MWRWEWLNQTIMMRPFKSTNFLATFLLLGIMAFTFSACSNDEETSTLQPYVCYWQCLDEDREYYSILTIYEDGIYQFLYQDGSDKGAESGMMVFDRNMNTMTFSPRATLGSDTKDSEYEWIVRGLSDSRLQIIDENGNSYTYEKITDGTFTPHDDWGKSLVGGTWEIYTGSVSETRRYTFFEGGTYSCWNEHLGIYEDGIYMFDKKTITIDGEQGNIVTFTSNSIKFSMDDVIYSGTRIVEKDKKLVESNKKLLIGTWSCVVGTCDGDEKSVLILKPNGEYEIEYLDDSDIYKGSYYVSEDKIFFEDATGKNPIGAEYQIEKLASEGFALTNFYDEEYIIGTKTK